MKMRKLSALLMSGVLTASALAGCGSDAANGAQTQTDSTAQSQTAQADTTDAAAVETQDVSLKIWVPEEAVEDTDAAVKAFDDLHDEFNITYEIAVVG
ncbi:MAG: sugar ABC transporter substrate-binding protein, partial [Oscillospiraceae bacterium]|nr:sugar ABC transporter substrate-binding protein [Oscillospiraceae bacterium]